MAKKPTSPKRPRKSRIDVTKLVTALRDTAATMRGEPSPLDLPVDRLNALVEEAVGHFSRAEEITIAIRIVLMNQCMRAERRGYSKRTLRSIRKNIDNARDILDVIMDKGGLAETLLETLISAAEVYDEMIERTRNS